MGPIFKSYLKTSLKAFLLSLLFPAVVYFFVEDKEIIYWFIALDILGFIPGYYRYCDQLVYEEKLKKRGLTPKDLTNIKFVKNWDDTRKKGLIIYTLVYGGIFYGFAICGIISIICALIKKHLMTYLSASPSNMFNFIGYTYLAGAIIGIIIFRYLWIYNEQKFIRLTDPLH